MKKKITAILFTIALLAGCEAAPATAQEDTPDIDAIVQQSVAEAIAQYKEEQKEKDVEIAGLKAQLEELTSQTEGSHDDADPTETTTPAEESPAPASSQPEEPEAQTDPEPEKTAPAQSSALSSCYDCYDGFDLKSLYPAFIWENFQPIEEDYSTDQLWEQEYEGDDYEEPPLGTLLEDDALEVIRLTNQERENHGLEPLEIDDDLMALAEIRAEEASFKYSHERPDGTRVSQMGYYGENLGAKVSAEKQVASWMSSDGHRANILREGYHRIGVGCYLGQNAKHYWIQVFSK